MEIQYGGVIGLVILVLDIWGLLNVVQSHATLGMKVFWCVVILLLPIIGLVLWFLLGPKG
ncbi:MAG: PLD nuclease N-terminal domain-containing protein [Gammaproteobacteria bacterium]|nr:PLD nuclease N-terminal domain-containing protein [Gammaproteobacteria bacterium]